MIKTLSSAQGPFQERSRTSDGYRVTLFFAISLRFNVLFFLFSLEKLL
jgi:hypothetical protein